MKNVSVKKIVGGAVLVALLAATVAGVILGLFGRTTAYADIHTETPTPIWAAATPIRCPCRTPRRRSPTPRCCAPAPK